MGKRGPTRRRPAGRILEPTQLKEPVLPAGLCSAAVAAWEAFWSDPVSSAATPADRSLVLRWLDATNRYLVSVKLADAEPLVTGSTGQQVPNALYRIADQALGAVERCERQLGIGARNRAGLGSALLSETKTATQLNQRFETPLSIVTDDESHDPRTHPPA